jgi:hypothetical protein
MMIHAFLFQWKPQATEADKQRAAAEIPALQKKIPGIVEASYSANTSTKSQGFTHGGVIKFRDAAAMHAYFTHPVHDELLDWLMPLLAVAAELDYEM